ncbi:hypothetical protein MMC30_000949 [Trapelia coarctata]|nr:hypothetical protein [Trapelia coarctata]
MFQQSVGDRVGNYSVRRIRCPYSKLSELNTLDLYLPYPPSSADDATRYWIIYIHGGAWRDPIVTSTSIQPALEFLDPRKYPIAGVASINYRLSPYASHPSHPSSPDDPSRNVTHPAHLEDVMTAITMLQGWHGFGKRYVLVGHSCGATLAFQTVMGLWAAPADLVANDAVLEKPVAIVGVAGIYDLPLLASTFRAVPLYGEFLEGAFGKDYTDWLRASPASGEYHNTWQNAKAVVLGWSKDDTLVDETQLRRMAHTLLDHTSAGRADMAVELKGGHNDIWQNGTCLAKAITTALSMLKEELP